MPEVEDDVAVDVVVVPACKEGLMISRYPRALLAVVVVVVV